MLRVGITGGIGSGKTTVCRIFETLGIPVYDADARAKWLLENDPELIAGIRDLFGNGAYTAAGQYNRPFIAQIVFNDPDKLAALNALAHPAVEHDSRAWHDAQKDVPFTLKEAALMVESGSHRYLDLLIVVAAPEALRIDRVVARDGITREQVERRIANQMPEQAKIALADFVIHNDGEQALIPQVVAVYREIVSGFI